MIRPIETARRAAGMTQESAAAILGKSQSHYGKIEREQVGLSAHDALKLCKAWNITISQLLTGN